MLSVVITLPANAISWKTRSYKQKLEI